MPLPFFCTVCDKPIKPSKFRKYATIHDKCMLDYLDNFHGSPLEDFDKNENITNLPKKPKK